jgi:hypothetical protein
MRTIASVAATPRFIRQPSLFAACCAPDWDEDL